MSVSVKKVLSRCRLRHASRVRDRPEAARRADQLAHASLGAAGVVLIAGSIIQNYGRRKHSLPSFSVCPD